MEALRRRFEQLEARVGARATPPKWKWLDGLDTLESRVDYMWAMAADSLGDTQEALYDLGVRIDSIVEGGEGEDD